MNQTPFKTKTTFVRVTLCHPNNTEDQTNLLFTLNPTPIAVKWALELVECQLQGATVQSIDRFYNFPGHTDDALQTWQQLVKCIDTVNAFEPGSIPLRPELTTINQTHLNDLHNYFEKYRGAVDNTKSFFEKAAEDVQEALFFFNQNIHRLEDLMFESKTGFRMSKFKCNFYHRRNLLEDDEFDYFRMDRNFGDLVMEYAQVGKDLLTVMRDDDEVEGNDNIRPQNYWASDFEVWLGDDISEADVARTMAELEIFWQRKSLERHGFRWGDKRNSLGMIPIARLNDSREREAIVQDVANHQRIFAVNLEF